MLESRYCMSCLGSLICILKCINIGRLALFTHSLLKKPIVNMPAKTSGKGAKKAVWLAMPVTIRMNPYDRVESIRMTV